MRIWGILLIAVLLVVIGYLALLVIGNRNAGRSDGSGPMGPMMGPRRSQAPSTFRSNGERIYHTATSDYGDQVTFSGGPHWLYMHGGSCVSCHGPGGKGGESVSMAPDIRYSTLTCKTAMAEEHPLYTDALIKRAITKGLDPAGKSLSDEMPRWRLSERDLNDIVAYLKTLSKRESK